MAVRARADHDAPEVGFAPCRQRDYVIRLDVLDRATGEGPMALGLLLENPGAKLPPRGAVQAAHGADGWPRLPAGPRPRESSPEPGIPSAHGHAPSASVEGSAW